MAQGETVARTLPGREIFRLYDTYGFPFDLTVELAREQGLEVDQVGFEEALAAQREISRGGAVDAFRDRSRSRAESMSNWPRGRPSSLAMRRSLPTHGSLGSSARTDRL